MGTQELVVITSYPPQGEVHGKGTVGIASYAKNTLLSLLKASQQDTLLSITVLAEKLPNSPKNEYVENDMQVKRIWQRNDPFIFIKLFQEVCRLKATNVMIEFELSMFGGILTLLFFPIFLLGLYIAKKKTFLVLHQVIEDIGDFSGHVNIEKGSLKALIINLGTQIFYRLTLNIAHKTIVFEEQLKQSLSRITTSNHLTVIPHGVESFQTKLTYKSARKKLSITDEFVIVCFGFLAWYKGSDWIVEQIQQLSQKNKKIKLILAGGPNPNHKDKEFYQNYIKNIYKEADQTSTILVTGFVPEEEIATYYLASDLLLFPYRSFMSSSGPLSLAFSFNKPFFISQPLTPIFKTDDMAKIMKEQQLTAKDLSFSFEVSNFIMKLESFMQSSELSNRIQKVSKQLHAVRNFEAIGEQYYKEILR